MLVGVYLVIACIFGFIMWFETKEQDEIDFYPSGIGSAMTYLGIIGLSCIWPILLVMMLYDAFKETRLDR